MAAAAVAVVADNVVYGACFIFDGFCKIECTCHEYLDKQYNNINICIYKHWDPLFKCYFNILEH
jgi:hypothetical protein